MDSAQGASPTRAILSVSQFCTRTRKLLETDIGNVWISGEVASFTAPRSGHWYLNLKDESAQIRCVMFRNANINCREPSLGDEILVCGRASLYEARGEMQLILSHLEQRGSGMLFQRFEALKAKLKAEGLFDTERKQPLPTLARNIAVVTSPTGAALQDIRRVFEKHRFGGLVRVFPAQVQGETAPAQLVNALQQADADPDCEMILLARGGGSYEDLFCFNDEALARCIAGLGKPVVSAIGHETDTTIADFVADLSCATPTAGAEQILQRWSRLEDALQNARLNINRAIIRRLQQVSQRLDELQRRVTTPARQVALLAERQSNLQRRADYGVQRTCDRALANYTAVQAKLEKNAPRIRWQQAKQRLAEMQHLLQRSGQSLLTEPRHQLARQARYLEAVSPLATLGRGYSLLMDEQGNAVRDASQVEKDQRLKAQLSRGALEVTVLQAFKPED